MVFGCDLFEFVDVFGIEWLLLVGYDWGVCVAVNVCGLCDGVVLYFVMLLVGYGINDFV